MISQTYSFYYVSKIIIGKQLQIISPSFVGACLIPLTFLGRNPRKHPGRPMTIGPTCPVTSPCRFPPTLLLYPIIKFQLGHVLFNRTGHPPDPSKPRLEALYRRTWGTRRCARWSLTWCRIKHKLGLDHFPWFYGASGVVFRRIASSSLVMFQPEDPCNTVGVTTASKSLSRWCRPYCFPHSS
jgi:hypothetical protein